MRWRRGLPRLRWASALLALAGLLAAGLVGATGRAAEAASTPPRPVGVVVESDGLRVTVTAAGSGTSTTLRFTLTATDGHAHGALGYDVVFGDGKSTSNPVPQFCVAGTGISQHDVWHLAHRYAAGTYHATFTVRANCTRAVTRARLTVRAA